MATREPGGSNHHNGSDDRPVLEREIAALRAELAAVRAARGRNSLKARLARLSAIVRARWDRVACWLATGDAPSVAHRAIPRHHWEWGLLGAILAVAGYVRFHDLSASPPGMHGDEAVAALEGQRILDEGWIGPYSPGALGQPTGPLYLTALSLRLFGDTIFAVRFVPAVGGFLTVAVWYVVLRRNLGAAVGLVGAGLLAVLGWHIHFARIGFPLETWPLVVALTTGALAEAVRSGRVGWWAATGALAGLGIYAYNAHPVFLAALGLFVLQRLYGWRPVGALAALGIFVLAPNALWMIVLAVSFVWVLSSARLASGDRLAQASAFGAALAIVAVPMARFATDPANGYLAHARLTSVLNKDAWTGLEGVEARTRFLVDRYFEFWNRLAFAPVLDGADATGVAPVVPWATLAVAAIGAAIGLVRRKEPLVAFGALVVLVMPIAAVVSVDGAARRTFAMAPFLALLGAVGVVGVVRLGFRRGTLAGILAGGMAAALVGFGTYQNLNGEFGTVRGSPEEAWVFAQEMTEAALFMDTLPPRSHVYFYSDRWSVDYETRQFLAPDVSAEDRSSEFGNPSYAIDPTAGDPVFVFLGGYRDRLDAIRARYPGGEVVQGNLLGHLPTFVAYVPPARVVPDEPST